MINSSSNMVLSEEQVTNIITGMDNAANVQINSRSHKLKQRYVVVRKLGQGTYGKVQLAINKETRLEVAIKTIKKKRIQNEQDLQRIRREIQILSSVTHPHIVHIYEVFENRDKMVLVMEYAAGGELFDYLSEHHCLSDEEARRIFRQIVSACYYCHQNNICHRDLKLENILLDEFGNAKIADFGLSTVFGRDAGLVTYCGSPLYASPEIVSGTPYRGPEVDCWSLGVLLYTLVYGAMPFDGSNFRRLVRQITTGRYHEPDPPSAASDLIARLLTVNRDARIQMTDVCRHWWINEGTEHCCLHLSQQLCEQTPVRLDVLLSLTADSVKHSSPAMKSPTDCVEQDVDMADVSADDKPAQSGTDEDICCSDSGRQHLHPAGWSWESPLGRDASCYMCLEYNNERLRRRPIISAQSLDHPVAKKRELSNDCDAKCPIFDSLIDRVGSYSFLTSRSISVKSLPCQLNELYSITLRPSLSLPSCHRVHNYYRQVDGGKFTDRFNHVERKPVPDCRITRTSLSSTVSDKTGMFSGPGSGCIPSAALSSSRTFSWVTEPSLAVLRLKSSQTVAGICQGVGRRHTVHCRPVGFELTKVPSSRGGMSNMHLHYSVLSSSGSSGAHAVIDQVSPRHEINEFSSADSGDESGNATLPLSQIIPEINNQQTTTSANKPPRPLKPNRSRILQSVEETLNEGADNGPPVLSEKPVFRSELSIDLSRKGCTSNGRKGEIAISQLRRSDSPVKQTFPAVNRFDSGLLFASSDDGSSATELKSVNSDDTIIAASPKPLRKSHREVIIPILLEDGGAILPSTECVTAASGGSRSQHDDTPGARHLQEQNSLLGISHLGVSSRPVSPHSLRTRLDNVSHKLVRLSDSQQRMSALRPTVCDSSPLSSWRAGSDSESSDGEPDTEPFSLCTADSLFSTLLQRLQFLSRQTRTRATTGIGNSPLSALGNGSGFRHAALTLNSRLPLLPPSARSNVLHHRHGTFVSYQHVNIGD